MIMAGVTVKKTNMTHKDGKPRRVLRRTRASINGQPVDLRKLAARRKLTPRR